MVAAEGGEVKEIVGDYPVGRIKARGLQRPPDVRGD